MKQLFLLLFFLLTQYVICVAQIVPGRTYKISSYYSTSKSLSVKNSSLAEKTAIVLWTETNVNSQRWIAEQATGDFFYLTNAYSGKALHYVSKRPKPGDLVDQDINDGSSFCQWEFVPVENRSYREGYYIRFSMKSSNDYLYLEVSDNTDGSEINVQLKKTGNDSIRQIWRISPVESIPNKLTANVRNEMMQGWKDYYYKKANVGYVIGDGGWWGDAEMFETILDAYETTGDAQHKEMFTELYKNFTVRNRTDWSYNTFNDDIAWMVIAAARAYLMFDDAQYLNHARNNFDKMYARALLPSGMLRWEETPANNKGTNSCINGPAEVAACYLAIATGENSYYEKAKSLYALQRQYLYEPSTGKVFDSGSWNNNVFTINNHWVSTYNQGTFLGAALMLYNRYGDEQYKLDAHKIVEWTHKDLCNEWGIIRVCGSGNDLQGFKGILMRYLRRYIVDLAMPDSVEWMQKNALHAYNNRNSKKISWTAWWEKSTENFILSDGYNYVNQPFGASTAVSAAFNAPLDKNLVIKNAFSTIEAGHFDYLKGIFVEPGNEGEMTVVGNIQNNYYTAYNNVDFSGKQVENAIFHVQPAGTAGTIEIRLNSQSGRLIGTASIPADNSGTWTTVSCPVENVSGRQNIYLVYKGTGFKLDSFKFNNGSAGIAKQSLASFVELYPNPATDYVNIKTPQSGYLTICDSSGKQLFAKNVPSGVLNLNVENYAPGVYFINIITSEGKFSIPFLKK